MYGLSERCRKELTDILSSIPAIEEAVIYGSRARGDYKPTSDIDITLKGKDLTFRDLALLDDKLYYSYLPYSCDTSIMRDLTNNDLIHNIEQNGKVFYKRNKGECKQTVSRE